MIPVDIRSIQFCRNSGYMSEVFVPSHSEEDKVYSCVVQEPGDVDDVVCECEGFQFRGSCSHQAEAIKLVCGWTDLASDVQQSREDKRNKICPRCGGPTERILVSVDG